MAHGRCSNLVFKDNLTILYQICINKHSRFNALISPAMVDLIHAAAMIKICYQYKPIICVNST
jgi:hypothetical protein